METIDTQVLHIAGSAEAMWAEVATQVGRWLDGRGLSTRDACVLLPFAELLPPAKRAFAASAGWMPRIHTTQTLARELAPTIASDGAGPSGHAAIDTLLAEQLLRQPAWGRDWARRDPGAFQHAVSRVVRTAHAVLRGAQGITPDGRQAYWARVQQVATSAAGIDGGLLRVAVEWAAMAPPPPTDVLFTLRPSAWIAVQFGGEDSLASALTSGRSVPALHLWLDAEGDDPFSLLPGAGVIDVVRAGDAEAEAMSATCEVVAALDRGEGPVALVAEDRALVRRVRALLERTGTAVDDETGWPLSTTRAGARVMAALRAAHPAASQDDLLDWLKSAIGIDDQDDLAALERSWRRPQRQPDGEGAAAQQLWARERARLRVFADPGRRSVAAWLQALDDVLFGADIDASWQVDAASQQLRRTLWLDSDSRGAAGRAWLEGAMTLDGFTSWVQRALEEARFVPDGSGAVADVVITPLSRAIGRPFGTVVVPGADAQRLALADSPDLLLSDAAMRALGLPHLAQRRRRQAQGFVHLLRSPKVVLLWRQTDGDETMAPSALVDRLRDACIQADRPIRERDASVPMQAVDVQLAPVPMPTVGTRLPATWTASAVESLRQCPYQFFARVVLGLREDDELDDDVDKRDFGAWIHATLERFHAGRPESTTEADDVRRLVGVARDTLEAYAADHRVDRAALLPYTAGFEHFAGRYVSWLHGHERDGWRYEAGEVDRTVALDAADDIDAGIGGSLRLRGRIDRIDRQPAQTAVQVIDYKTGARDQLTRRVRQPLEDTQLAVYAALLLPTLSAGTAVSAAYLALDDSDGVVEIAHENVAETAHTLTRALADERRRMLAGAPLPPLGQGSVCDYCEARGLCRRDHWAQPESA